MGFKIFLKENFDCINIAKGHKNRLKIMKHK